MEIMPPTALWRKNENFDGSATLWERPCQTRAGVLNHDSKLKNKNHAAKQTPTKED